MDATSLKIRLPPPSWRSLYSPAAGVYGCENVPDNKLMWYVIIHLTFVLSAFVMGYLDRLTKVKH